MVCVSASGLLCACHKRAASSLLYRYRRYCAGGKEGSHSSLAESSPRLRFASLRLDCFAATGSLRDLETSCITTNAGSLSRQIGRFRLRLKISALLRLTDLFASPSKGAHQTANSITIPPTHADTQHAYIQIGILDWMVIDQAASFIDSITQRAPTD